jgi:hypothetical protein
MFLAFLEKEFSAENLRYDSFFNSSIIELQCVPIAHKFIRKFFCLYRFWLACQELKQTPRMNVPNLVNKIFR